MASYIKTVPKEMVLYYAMSQFSWEKHFSGWLMYFDLHLYRDVFHNASSYELSDAEKEQFQQLARSANGWWYWAPDDNEPRFLTFEEMDDLVWLH